VLATQLVTPLARVALDDRYANKFTPLDSTVIYLKPGHKLLYTPMTGEMKCARLYLCHAHSISCSPSVMQHMHQPITMIWSTLYHYVTILIHRSWLHLLFTIASVHQRQVITQLTLHTCNWSVEPSLVLIFSTLVTWLHVMSHMQWAPSSHVWALQYLQAIFTSMAYVALTHVSVD
jgi:small-conductance mechanosensitive channel